MLFFTTNQKRSSYISEINEANTMENLLNGHENVQITVNYSHLTNEEDYKTLRFVKKTNSGDYYSYYRTDGMEEDYREVIRNKQVYRYDGRYVYYYGLLDNDYEDVCLAQIEGDVYQVGEDMRITDEQESGDFLKVEATYDVTEGDEYTTKYGFKVGDQITQTLTLDKESMIVLTAVESCNGEEFHSYTASLTARIRIRNSIRISGMQSLAENVPCTMIMTAITRRLTTLRFREAFILTFCRTRDIPYIPMRTVRASLPNIRCRCRIRRPISRCM